MYTVSSIYYRGEHNRTYTDMSSSEDYETQADTPEDSQRSTRGSTRALSKVKSSFPLKIKLLTKSPQKRGGRGPSKRKRIEGVEPTSSQCVSVDIESHVSMIVEQVTERIHTKLDTLLEGLIDKKIDTQLKPHIAKLQANTEDVANLTGDVNKLRQEVVDLQKQLSEHVHFTKDKTESLELHGRKLNLIFEGVRHREGEDCKRVVDSIITREMNLKMHQPTDIAHRLPSKNPKQPPPMIARFRTVADKSRVLQNRTAATKAGIYIRQDLPQTMIQRRSYVAKSLESAKKIDPDARMIRDKLFFNNKVYTAQNICQAPIRENTHTEETEQGVKFYGYLSPFSNFHAADLKLDGRRYTCVEQAYHSIKAEQCGDFYGAQLIRRERHPVAIKRMGRVHEIDESVKINILEKAVQAKFSQNKELMARLLNTGDKKLFECNPFDELFGTGCYLSDEAVEKGTFKGKNEMGHILERVRSLLKP